MSHCADHSKLIRNRCQPRQFLANPEPRSSRSDRLIRSPNTSGGIRLHVKRFQLTGPAEQKHKHHRLCSWLASRTGLLGGEQRVQIRSQQPNTTGVQHVSSRHTVTKPFRPAVNREHRSASFGYWKAFFELERRSKKPTGRTATHPRSVTSSTLRQPA